MLEPGDRVAEQGLAEPVMVHARQPLGFGEEIVDLAVGLDRKFAIVGQSLATHAGAGIAAFVPLLFVVLLEERAVAEPARLAGEFPAILQLLAMFAEEAKAVILLGDDVAPSETEIVDATVRDAPEVPRPAGRARVAEDLVAVVVKVRAIAPSRDR